MDRRLLITTLACWPAAQLLAQEASPQPRHKISAGQLHDALSARFPRRLRIGGLFDLQVSAPGLLLLPARNQLGATLVASLSGVPLGQAQGGEVDLVFSPRWEPLDQSVRAHRPEILDVRWAGLPPETIRAVKTLLPALARDALGELVLHRFSSRELALADTMGLAPDTMTVVADGVMISFATAPRR